MSAKGASQGGGVKGLYALKSEAGRGGSSSGEQARPHSAGNRNDTMDESGPSVEQRLKIVKRHRGSKDASAEVPVAVEPADQAYPRCATGGKVAENRVLQSLVVDAIDKEFFPDVISL